MSEAERPTKKARLLSSYFSSHELADVILEGVFEGQVLTRIPAHRIVLATASNFFAQLLTNGMRETGAPTIQLVLESVEEGPHLDHLIKCIYEHDEHITTACQGFIAPLDAVLDMYRLADRYLVPRAVDCAVNALRMWDYTLEQADSMFTALAEKRAPIGCAGHVGYCLAGHIKINKEEDDAAFLSLSFHGVCGLLASDYIATSGETALASEDDVLHAARRWFVRNGGGHDWVELVKTAVRFAWLPYTTLVNMLTDSVLGPALHMEIGHAFQFRAASTRNLSVADLAIERRDARYCPVIKNKIGVLAADSVRTMRWGGCEWTITRHGTTLIVETSRLTDVAVYVGHSGWVDVWFVERFFNSTTKDTYDGLKDGETYDLQFALSPDEQTLQERLWEAVAGPGASEEEEEDSDDDD